MKKITLILALSSAAFALQSCTTDRPVENTVNNTFLAEVFQGTTTLKRDDNSGGRVYTAFYDFSKPIPDSDMILAYRLTSDNKWQLLPVVLPTSSGGIEYNFAFTTSTISVTATAGFDIAEQSGYITNQTFRFLVVPANRVSKNSVDFNDYEQVVKVYNLTNANVITLK